MTTIDNSLTFPERFALYRDHHADCNCDIEGHKAGRYVLMLDYERLRAALQADRTRTAKAIDDAISLLIRIGHGDGVYRLDLGDCCFDSAEWLQRRDAVVTALRELDEAL
jgi:hypothetical protein